MTKAQSKKYAKELLARIRRMAGGTLPSTVTDWCKLARAFDTDPHAVNGLDRPGYLRGRRVYYDITRHPQMQMQAIAHELAEYLTRLDMPGLWDDIQPAAFNDPSGDPRHYIAEAFHKLVAAELCFDTLASAMSHVDYLIMRNPGDRLRYQDAARELTAVSDPLTDLDRPRAYN